MNLLQSLSRRSASLTRRYDGVDFAGYDPLDFAWSFGGNTYMGMPGSAGYRTETLESNFLGMVQGAFKRNGIIYACMRARASVFSEGRFAYQKMSSSGRPGDYFGDTTDRRTVGSSGLQMLKTPWQNGTTGDLLTRTLLDADLAGNAYWTVRNGSLRRMRPDWVSIVMGSKTDREVGPDDLDAELLGYFYYPGGPANRQTVPVYLLADEVAHFAPVPDPIAHYRGMSWLTPIIREIESDSAATVHKLAFFQNGASLQTIISFKDMKQEVFEAFVKKMDLAHKGAQNAYKTLYLGGGADATVVGADLRQLDFKATQGAGEPLALDTPIPTPAGWTTMGEIRAGDQVLGRDGLPANVVAISPVHVDRQCYRVTFKDRTSIVADAGHLWVAMDRQTKARAERTYTTAELAELVNGPYSEQAHRVGIPASPVLRLPERDLLIDPYVLGAWLGDGATAGAAICGSPDDLKFMGGQIEAAGYTVTSWQTSPDKVDVIGLPGGLLAALRAVGVLGDKHIPTDYLRASASQRLALLQGLMDTDGSIGHVGKETCEFSSKWQRLAEQVAELARTLGYRATVSCKRDARSRTGSTWRVTFRADPKMMPFRLPRKVERCATAPHVRTRTIVSIEAVDSVPVRCVAVDTVDHLFLAGESMVPTHNTRIAAAAGVHPVIVGLSEGLQGSSLNAGNFGQARRQFSEGTLSTLWRNVAASMATLVPPPPGADLVIDTRDIPFLREDAKDATEIAQMQAATIVSLGAGGYLRDSIIAAVVNRDMTLLKPDPAWITVQLQAAGGAAPVNGNGSPPPFGGGVGPKALAPPGPQARTSIAIAAYEFDGEFTERAFNPDEPRVPAGHGGGGRWGKLGEALHAAKAALTGQDALDATPTEYRSGPNAHYGDYSGATFKVPAGAGSEHALAEYEGVEYQTTNSHLRHGPMATNPNMVGHVTDLTREMDAETAARIAEIDKTMAVSKLTADIQVSRVIKDGSATFGRDAWHGDIALKGEDFSKDDENYARWLAGERPNLTGLTWHELAYVSTSASDEHSQAFGERWARMQREHPTFEGEPAIMTIRVPAGTGAIQLGNLGFTEGPGGRQIMGSAELMLQRGLTMKVVADHGVDDKGFRRLDVEVVPGGTG